jgi:hypothetical protein
MNEQLEETQLRWQKDVDLLLGNDREISNYTTEVAK